MHSGRDDPDQMVWSGCDHKISIYTRQRHSNRLSSMKLQSPPATSDLVISRSLACVVFYDRARININYENFIALGLIRYIFFLIIYM